MSGPLFGAPSADNDLLLEHCTVEDQIRRYLNPIIVGRWGTGKTAILMSKANNLEKILSEVDRFSKRDWYIREQDLQPESIFELQRRFSQSKNSFNITLQKIWKSEILRRIVRILNTLRQYYKDKPFTNETHWATVRAISVSEGAAESLWSCVENVISVIFPSEDRRQSVEKFSEFFKELTSSKMNFAVQRCISDLEDNKLVIPVIGIEPLETPASDLDLNISISESVIAALLNCYRNDFIRSDTQRIKIHISIPWNRIAGEQIILPQHIYPYMEEIRWDKNQLRDFICKRIDWESRSRNAPRIHYRPNFDAWDAYFTGHVENQNYSDSPDKFEKSFDYVCRHTLWRARDLQTIARDCVEIFCNKKKMDFNEFFKKRVKVDEDSIRTAVSKNAEVNARLRIEEARRRYRFDFDLYEVLYGMKIPFEEGDLKARVSPESGFQDWSSRLETLWESGIIGYCVEVYSQSALDSFRSRFGDDSLRIVRNRKFIALGFLFQYNTPQSTRVCGHSS